MTSTIDALNNIMNGLAPTNPSKPAPVPADPVVLQEAATKKEELRSKLKHGTWMVEFTKVDGTPTVMECTLDGRYLPPSDGSSPNSALSDNPTTLRVYAVDREGWRSFKVLNVTKFYPKPPNL